MDLPSTSSQGGNRFVGSKYVFKKDELVQVITAVLYSLGYKETGKLLEEVLGIQLHSERINSCIDRVKDGKWDEVLEILRDLSSSVKKMSSVILKRKKLELLYGRDKVELVSRDEVLEDLKILIPPTLMIQEKRLIELFEQALDFQKNSCRFHNLSVGEVSLFTNHLCGREDIPSIGLEKIEGLWGEVWLLQFSHNGKYLAASTRDCFVIIWKVLESGRFSYLTTLMGHTKPVSNIAWSPDNNQLLTCGVEETVKRWNISPTGVCLFTYGKDCGTISCAWGRNGESIFVSFTDGIIVRWNLQGTMGRQWRPMKPTRIADLAMTRDGSEIIAPFKGNRILFFDWRWECAKFIKEDGAIVSFTLSEDGNFLLVSMLNEEIHLWNIEDSAFPVMVMKYKGHRRRRLVVKACFGGIGQGFIASGSEDSKVYIWNRWSGELICTLEGHSAVVNCVSWNPANPHMLASASDDRAIRIWGNSHI
ncbi:PREDICTED: WD repeat-containing protein 26-like [Erythranthe guttata]|nr:PREDICTED: WD repeat-containing protein 26-like [Erythranthe guttata]XP_012830913.1 PREDICTED: WD repeat-containing protein 26-like [Erythranthe guttata]|eukprot:XP_012830912.1 PREDICTED: WD repeat-containing protein 26-like [Erythranthe guttata]